MLAHVREVRACLVRVSDVRVCLYVRTCKRVRASENACERAFVALTEHWATSLAVESKAISVLRPRVEHTRRRTLTPLVKTCGPHESGWSTR